MRNRKHYFSIFLAFVFIFFISSLYVCAAEMIEGTEGTNLTKVAPIKRFLEPTYEFEQARHVANGVALRNRTSGTIHLRGVPVGRKIMKAFLYWTFLTESSLISKTTPILFNGNRVNGIHTATSNDPCWSGADYSHSYIADVTEYVLMMSHPNQDYEVVSSFRSNTVTTGESPWNQWIPEIPEIHAVPSVMMEGASLIVVYYEKESGHVFIYDKLNDSMFSSTAYFSWYNMAPGLGLFTMSGADGQLGHTNEKTFFDNIQIAGPPVTNSDWDGSDGWPLVQLWDTHTHCVKMEYRTSEVRFESNGDCIVPVVFVIDSVNNCPYELP